MFFDECKPNACLIQLGCGNFANAVHRLLPKIAIIYLQLNTTISKNIPKLSRKSVIKFFGCPLLKEIQAEPMGCVLNVVC